MSLSCHVLPLDAQTFDWAQKCHVPVRGLVASGRPATLNELMDVVSSVPGHLFTMGRHGDNFSIDVESEKQVTFECDQPCRNSVGPGLAVGPATYTSIHGGVLPTGTIEWMSFQGHMELLVWVVRRLTKTCGPQTFFAACDCIPWVVASSDAVPIGSEPWRCPLPDF